jgi:hypothetical protein
MCTVLWIVASAECHRPKRPAVAFRGQFQSGAARGGNPWANLTTKLAYRGSFESGGWHSIVRLRAEGHKSKIPEQSVAFRGQFDRRVRQITKIQHPPFCIMCHPV